MRPFHVVAACLALLQLIAAELPPPLPVSCGDSSTPEIDIKAGRIRGLQQCGYRAFVGIPYAEAPVGDLRFRPPVAHAPWSDTVDATTFGNVCVQENEREYQDEDCLFINVWAPAEDACPEAGCAVLVHIHGGGWVTGAGSDGMYWGPFMANATSEPIISVTFNYRLGAFGFMAIDNDGTWAGNQGFLDQRLALEWVQNNIVAFGGDAARVTLSGQSAGGISVLTHLTSPKSYGLFDQVIVQSGPATTMYRNVDDSAQFTEKMADQLGCAATRLECFQKKSTTEIINAQSKVHADFLAARPPIHAASIAPWMIVIDGENVLDTPYALLRGGKYAPISNMVVGCTQNETAGWMEEIPIPLTPALYDIALLAMFGNVSDSVSEEYPVVRTSPQNKYVLSAVGDDYVFVCANRNMLRLLAATPSANPPTTANYLFAHHPSSYPRNVGTVSHCDCDGCSCHGAELTFIHNSFAWSNASATQEESMFALSMVELWTSFVSSGFTNSFPVYSASKDNTYKLTVDASTEVFGYHQPQCDFWDSTGLYMVPT